MTDVLFLFDKTEKYPIEIRFSDCFFDYGLQLIKSGKNVDELFLTVEYLIQRNLIKAERVLPFSSDIFILILCCDHIFYQFFLLDGSRIC